MNFQELFEMGGPTMWPLLMLSILSLATIIERFWFWGNLLTQEKRIVNRVLEAARRDWIAAYEIAKQESKLPIGRFLSAPLRLRNPEPDLFRLALESTADEELASMRRGDKILEAVVALAPLLGLLGTVLGLIGALRNLHLGDVNTTVTPDVTGGISASLISTATGLIIAIASLAFYRVFQGFSLNQVKVFRKAGNDLELLYRQYWSQIQKNPDFALEYGAYLDTEKPDLHREEFKESVVTDRTEPIEPQLKDNYPVDEEQPAENSSEY